MKASSFTQSRSMRVVHLAPTVLAGAPGNLSDALNRYTSVASTLIQTGDYAAPERSYMAPSAIRFSSSRAKIGVRELCRDLIAEADIIHIHNTVSHEFYPFLFSVPTRARYVYHVHSPMFERPLFVDHSALLEIPIARKFVVGHFHPRCYPDFVPMPNIVPRFEPPRPLNPGHITVLFSPSHRTKGRWNSKTNEEFEKSMESLGKVKGLIVRDIEQVTPHELFVLRTRSDITIDEVVTGSFHLVSCEGLACGNVVVNGADALSLAAARAAFQTDEPPPFVRASERNVVEVVTELAASSDQLEETKQQSYRYFAQFLHPERLANLYLKQYQSLLT